MNVRKITLLVATLSTLSILTAAATAEPFSWIMKSASGAGALENGDGHYWTFRKAGNGWEVEGARGEVATATAAGENKVELYGFPDSWNANGGYGFSRADGKCALTSDHSNHALQWTC